MWASRCPKATREAGGAGPASPLCVSRDAVSGAVSAPGVVVFALFVCDACFIWSPLAATAYALVYFREDNAYDVVRMNAVSSDVDEEPCVGSVVDVLWQDAKTYSAQLFATSDEEPRVERQPAQQEVPHQPTSSRVLQEIPVLEENIPVGDDTVAVWAPAEKSHEGTSQLSQLLTLCME
ncbi:hypothetical protein HPB50_015858 [Hyalomma asiaticum]|uniref:Uncharacterized protein n=1 Tax=Hyalomma asiaticum TaxID=266040 RepID=A0ACB7SG22_HYAAI|nr:hypothetical protein HPB50_015858 [Hyalomma asiaticum]